jgi:ribulose-phosphate 3-epimerase
MPPAIISPSVLASDFGQLTAECKRMLRGGAQWLHMGTLGGAYTPVDVPFAECLRSPRCHGWVSVS